MEMEFIELDEFDFRLGLNELLSANGKIDLETNRLINQVILETKNRAMQAALQCFIDEGKSMTFTELMTEKHCSKRIGRHLSVSGYNRPSDDFEAHAIVSGGHSRAFIAREILAQFNIRIDEPVNGVWLPNFKKNLHLYPSYTQAHRNLHRKAYYLNITACLEQAMSASHARAILRRIAQGVVTGAFPIDRRIKAKEIMVFANG